MNPEQRYYKAYCVREIMKKSHSRLNTSQKLSLKNMAIEGLSLNQIARKTGIPKTTIYYNVKKYKPRQWRDLIVNISEEEIGELVGAFSGDGSYSYKLNSKSENRGGQHRIRYSLGFRKDKDYAKRLFKLLKGLNLNPFVTKSEKRGIIEVGLSSLQYLKFLKKYLEWDERRTYSVRLNKKVNEYDRSFLRGFARGLMDTDGFVETSGVACGCTSRRLINNLKDIFDLFKIENKVTIKKRSPERKDLFLVRVPRAGLGNYIKEIEFSNKSKLEALEKIR